MGSFGFLVNGEGRRAFLSGALCWLGRAICLNEGSKDTLQAVAVNAVGMRFWLDAGAYTKDSGRVNETGFKREEA